MFGASRPSRRDHSLLIEAEPEGEEGEGLLLDLALDFLIASGFRLVSVQPIDMMPQTRQVEAING